MMNDCSSYEKQLLKNKLAHSFQNIGYYPDIAKYHDNALMSYFDSLNMNYTVQRKERIRQIKDKQQLESYIKEIKASYRDCIGEMPEKTDIRSEVVRTTDKGEYLINNVLIESLPGYYLSANYYYPKNNRQKAPGILFLCGHSSNGKAAEMYVAFCVEAALNGFCILTFDPVGQGERVMYSEKDGSPFDQGNPDHVHYTLGQRISLTGDNITKYMMWDNIRALDYLCSRSEVDLGRLAVTGNSGGGQMSAFMGAYDDRLHVIAPCCYITDLRSMIYHIGAQESEQSVPNFMKAGLDLADLITMAAPKPYFMGTSLLDFFPIEGARDAFVEARRFYSMLDAEDNIEIYTSPKPHGFWHDTREKVLRFLCRHLGMQFVENKAIDYENLPEEKELLCTPNGDIDSYNTVTIHQILQSRAKEVYPGPVGIDLSKPGELESYKRTIRNSAIRILGLEESRIKHAVEDIEKQYDAEKGWFVTNITFYSEEHMRVRCTLYEKEEGQSNSVMIHVGETPKDSGIEDYLREYSGVFCLEPRGTGKNRMEPGCWFYTGDEIQNEEASYNCNADMLGSSVLGMMVQDVLSLQKMIYRSHGDVELSIYGREENAITALFAALIGNIRNVRLDRLLYSYRSFIENKTHCWSPSIFVNGLLGSFDIPDLLQALATANVFVDGLLDQRKKLIDSDVI